MDNSDGESKTQRSSSVKIKRHTSQKSSSKSKKKTDKDKERSRSQEPIEMLTPKQNGYVEADDGEDEDKMKHTASIKGMWKKAFKSLKSNDKQTNWLSKKGSLIRRKDSEPPEEEPQEVSKEIDPVYSLLKCAADLPKVPKAQKEAQCSGHLGSKGDSSGSTSKASSPSSSGVGLSQSHQASQGNISSHQNINDKANEGSDGRATSPTSPTITNRDHMHHIVDESLGSEFRTFYRLTSPVRKHWSDSAAKKNSNTNYDYY